LFSAPVLATGAPNAAGVPKVRLETPHTAGLTLSVAVFGAPNDVSPKPVPAEAVPIAAAAGAAGAAAPKLVVPNAGAGVAPKEKEEDTPAVAAGAPNPRGAAAGALVAPKPSCVVEAAGGTGRPNAGAAVVAPNAFVPVDTTPPPKDSPPNALAPNTGAVPVAAAVFTVDPSVATAGFVVASTFSIFCTAVATAGAVVGNGVFFTVTSGLSRWTSVYTCNMPESLRDRTYGQGGIMWSTKKTSFEEFRLIPTPRHSALL